MTEASLPQLREDLDGFNDGFIDFVPHLDAVAEIITDALDDFAAEMTNTCVIEFLDHFRRGAPPIDPSVVAIADGVIFFAR